MQIKKNKGSSLRKTYVKQNEPMDPVSSRTNYASKTFKLIMCYDCQTWSKSE
jgi:hypothetical protein